MSRLPQPTVSVAMITYNHEEYIRQAVDSVLSQKTDFSFELIIGDDCSTDMTSEIVRKYARENPGVIRLNIPARNIGAHKNFKSTIRACTGRYVALLDGDDFWNSEDKLQKQVDQLENDSRLSMSFHAVDELSEDERITKYPEGRRPTYSFADLAASYLTPTSSVVYRNGIFGDFPAWFDKAPVGDWPLFLLIASRGDIGYVDEIMSTHRVHPLGVWHANRDYRKSLAVFIELFELLVANPPGTARVHLSRSLYRFRYLLVHAHANAGNQAAARSTVRECLRRPIYDPKVGRLEPLSALVHAYFPRFYSALRASKRALLPLR